MKLLFLCAMLLVCPLTAIFADQESGVIYKPSMDGLTEVEMTPEQLTQALANFNNLTSDDIGSIDLQTPVLQTPGDVMGSGLMPKSDHLFERTPNMQYIQSDSLDSISSDIADYVDSADSADSTDSADSAPIQEEVVELAEKVTPIVSNDLPAQKLPSGAYLNEMGEICFHEPEPINLPNFVMPGSISARMPSVKLPSMNADFPDLNVQGQSAEFPEVNIGKINTELPSVNVQGISTSSTEFPDIDMPNMDSSLPEIAPAQALEVNMPKVSVPELDSSMPDLNIPSQAQMDFPEMDMPSMKIELPKLDAAVKENNLEFELPEMDLPNFETNMPEKKQSENVSVEFPVVRMPFMTYDTPEIVSEKVNVSMPAINTAKFTAKFADVSDVGSSFVMPEIRQAKKIVVPSMPMMNMQGAAANMPSIQMPGVSAMYSLNNRASAPRVIFPSMNSNMPNINIPSMPTFEESKAKIGSIPNIKICKKAYGCPDYLVANPAVYDDSHDDYSDMVRYGNPKDCEEPDHSDHSDHSSESSESEESEEEEALDANLGYFTIPASQLNQIQALFDKQAAKDAAEASEESEEDEEDDHHHNDIDYEQRGVRRGADHKDHKFNGTIRKYWKQTDLPNEVARAYGIFNHGQIDPKWKLTDKSFVGTANN